MKMEEATAESLVSGNLACPVQKYSMATTSCVCDDANSVFAALHAATGQAPRWNFHKYVISADGQTISSFGSRVNPSSTEITEVIEAALAAR